MLVFFSAKISPQPQECSQHRFPNPSSSHVRRVSTGEIQRLYQYSDWHRVLRVELLSWCLSRHMDHYHHRDTCHLIRIFPADLVHRDEEGKCLDKGQIIEVAVLAKGKGKGPSTGTDVTLG